MDSPCEERWAWVLANKFFPVRTPQQIKNKQQNHKPQEHSGCVPKRWGGQCHQPRHLETFNQVNQVHTNSASSLQLQVVSTFEDSSSTFTQKILQALHFCNNLAFQIRWPSLSRYMDPRIVNDTISVSRSGGKPFKHPRVCNLHPFSDARGTFKIPTSYIIK